MQKSIRIQDDDYDKLKARAEQAGVPLSKYVGMLLNTDTNKLKQEFKKAYQAIAKLEALTRYLR
jgi:hypothetical protein